MNTTADVGCDISGSAFERAQHPNGRVQRPHLFSGSAILPP
jgi:hypothetical protein